MLSLNVASKDKLDSKALYFVRTNAKGVSQNIEQDVCYGEVPSDPLADFDFILGQVLGNHKLKVICGLRATGALTPQI